MIKLTKQVLATLTLVTLSILLPVQVLANPGLRVAGVLLVTDVSPGETLTHKMNVGIGESDLAMDIAVEVRDLGESSARDFITINNPSFHLEPGQSQDVMATIKVPLKVGEGGRYAIIRIAQKPAAAAGISSLVAIEVPVRLTIKDSQLIHQGQITEVSAEVISGKPVDMFTTFKNTGNHHFKFKGEVTVSNARGEVLDTIYIPLILSPVIPSLSQRLKVSFIPKGALALGVYSVKSRVMLEDGTLLDEKEGSFKVTELYALPPAPAKMTISAGSAAALQTPDGAIAISFPQGALISEAEISLRYYPLQQIPAAPAGFNLATTVFRVDGLTGLLAKEAGITVKVSQADLDKAGGDASRLRLARWDETDNRWTVLETKVDKQAMTLSTNTNRLSIWAVMVATSVAPPVPPAPSVAPPAPPAAPSAAPLVPPAPPAAPPTEVSWPLIGGAAAAIIIIALLIFLLVRRRASLRA